MFTVDDYCKVKPVHIFHHSMTALCWKLKTKNLVTGSGFFFPHFAVGYFYFNEIFCVTFIFTL